MGESDLAFVQALVEEAGRKALKGLGRAASEQKEDGSLVTVMDREIEDFLFDGIRREYPNQAFLGEEFGLRGPRSESIWACDPIDGTTNYVHGLPVWGISLGFLERGVPEMGVVYLPSTGQMFAAVRGRGAYCNGERIQAVDADEISPEDTVCLTSNSLKSLNPWVLQGRLRCLGSIAAELAFTAQGSLKAVVGLHEGIVDIAAALCLGTEAGCECRYLSGAPMDIPALIESRRTREHFLVGSPGVIRQLSRELRARPEAAQRARPAAY